MEGARGGGRAGWRRTRGGGVRGVAGALVTQSGAGLRREAKSFPARLRAARSSPDGKVVFATTLRRPRARRAPPRHRPRLPLPRLGSSGLESPAAQLVPGVAGPRQPRAPNGFGASPRGRVSGGSDPPRAPKARKAERWRRETGGLGGLGGAQRGGPGRGVGQAPPQRTQRPAPWHSHSAAGTSGRPGGSAAETGARTRHTHARHTHMPATHTCTPHTHARHTYSHADVHTHHTAHMQMCTRKHTYTCTDAYMHTQHTHAHHTQVHVHTCTHMHTTHVHMQICTHSTHMHVTRTDADMHATQTQVRT